MSNITEILAPAGSMEALQAAVANGAHAVYLGGKNFSARSYAANFEREELCRALDYAHLHQVKVYLTLNTLLSDQELPEALEYLGFLAEIGVDAVIIQDLGLLTLAHRVLPNLPLHASTQMTVSNSAAAAFLRARGISRFILPRELSLANIKAMKKKSQGELEVFVHGALCISYSGQCLMSSLIGARSGNRGCCAQPCRLAYTLLADEKERQETIPLLGAHLLSPRDLYAYPRLKDYYELGLAAWKIEGRMKKPEYVAMVTQIYGRALKALAKGEEYFLAEDLDRLEQVFNRDHTGGYAFTNPGKQLMSWQRPNNRGVFLGRIKAVQNDKIQLKLERNLVIGDGLEIWLKVGGRQGFTVDKIIREGKPVTAAKPGDIVTLFSPWGKEKDRVFKTHDRLLMEEARRSWQEAAQIPLKINIKAELGEPLKWEVEDDLGHKIGYTGDYIAQEAQTSPSDWPSLEKQVKRLGGSGFALKELNGKIDEKIILPASVLNQDRRHLVELIKKARTAQFAVYKVDKHALEQEIAALKIAPNAPKAQKICLTALVSNAKGAILASELGIKQIYLTTEPFRPLEEKINWNILVNKIEARGAKLIPALPRIWHEDKKEFWDKELKSWQDADINTLLVSDWGALQLAKEYSYIIYGDSSLNAYNRQTCLALAKSGVKRQHLSFELNQAQMADLGAMPIEREWTVFGRQTLMISEYCLLGAALGERETEKPCSRPCRQEKSYSIKDEKGFAFPIRFDQNCRMQVFNSRPTCLIADLPTLARSGITHARLDLRLADQKEIQQAINLFQRVLNEDLAADIARRELLKDGQFTKGHLYRGVVRNA